MRRLFGMALVSLATLSPNWALADDQSIAQDILQKLQEKKEAGKLKGFDLNLDVEEGTVWIKGHVANEEQQALVLDVAQRVSGVTQVVNDISVAPAPSAKRNTTANAKQESRSGILESMKSNFSKLAGGKATPKAVAPAPSAKRNTTANAKQESQWGMLVSLKSISSKLAGGKATPKAAARQESEPVAAVSATSEDSDALVRTIADRLQKARQAGKLRGFDFVIECDAETVWLSGHVANEQQHSLVIETVRRVPGVSQVVNDLKIANGSFGLAAHSQPEGTGVAGRSARVQQAPHVEPMHHADPSVPGVSPRPLAGSVQQHVAMRQVPLAIAPTQIAQGATHMQGAPVPMHSPGGNVGIAPARYDQPNMPGYAWPSYASHPNYAGVTYPKQYSPAAWPYIGPFYPYPQVPLGWRKVMLQWDDGWWFLDFKDK
ncbi:MAG: BON domain-containing protein [Planctomycetes bacterium]|nr:BON domain-containing protein [Planctomycetota bacterium]